MECEMPDDLREGYGYPEITREDRENILGKNFARLMGVDIEDKKRELGLERDSPGGMNGDPIPPRQEIDREILDERLGRVGRALDAHAGGIELVDIEADGQVRVRFTGMCTGCPLRPVEPQRLVRPVLEGVDGVTGVVAEGGRLSREAETRLFDALQESGSACLIAAITDAPDDRATGGR